MSLIRQLWLAVIVGSIIAFAGSFLVSMLTARQYLEQQLSIKNADNAASLALSMSQQTKDDITVELQVAALADSGQYRTVRILRPDGQVMIERASPPAPQSVPSWFVTLFPIEAPPGKAQISNGWKQFGTVVLISHDRFAYQELWSGSLRLLGWFAGGGVIFGMLGMLFLRSIRRPLLAVVNQARAISQRRFVTIDEPRTPELRSMARAMNIMVGRLKAMFAEEAVRLESLRREATLDALTGLSNRTHFLAQLDAALTREDAPPNGVLFMLRLNDLAGINRVGGREAADTVIKKTASALADAASRHPGALAARLNGADFALLAPSLEHAEPIAHLLLESFGNMVAAGLLNAEHQGHVASGRYRQGDPLGNLLARIDAALAAAETQGALGWVRAEDTGSLPAASNADWRILLEGAVETQRLRLIEFPVADRQGQLLHLECPLRLQATEGGDWLTAGSFMPMASRLAMTTELDLAATQLALDRIAAGVSAVAVNLSGESVFEPGFRARLFALLEQHPSLAPRLWLEVSEIGVFQHFFAFKELCNALHPLGCRLGIEHFGRQFSEIGHLHDIGLDYLKVDSSFIRGIDQQPGNQTFLKGLCNIAHNMGFTVIAEGVQTNEELAILPELGFDGATGPAVSVAQSDK